MKNMFKFRNLMAVTLALSIAAGGCLKDKNVEDNKAQFTIDNSNKIAELLGPSASSSPVTQNLEFSDKDTTFNAVVVNLAADQPLKSDLQVILKLDTALVNTYNAAHNTSLVIPPAAAYKIPSLVVTIPAGKREGYLKITTKPSVVANQNYAFGFTIASVSDAGVKISGNFNSQIISIGVKNKYDGVYSLRFKTVGWSAYGISDNLPATWPSNGDGTSISMITSGSNSIKLFDDYAFGAYIQVAFTTGNAAVTGFGATQPKFLFDVATNKITSVVNDAVPDSRNRAFRINTAINDNRYDAATKTIYAAYIMSQNGRPDQFIYDTLTFKFAR